MSKVNNYRMGAAFSSARYFLSEPGTLGKQEKNEFICHALYDAYKAGWLTCEEMMAAREIVMERLEDDHVEGWLQRKGYLPKNITMDQSFDLCQEYRHRWLNALSLEFCYKVD